MTFVADLEPKILWRHFDKILTIPRGSKQEEQMREYVVEQAKKHGFRYKVDAAGNVVVIKPGTGGREDAPVTVLQAHLDMVNEKNSDVEHDFDKDPILPQRDGDYLKATGTTLGSDNGIGVAAMLALMDETNVEHGPLELLFTIDEETGLTGAAELADDMLEGRRLINLDTEEEGAFYVGCAGGGDTNLTLPVSTTALPNGFVCFELKLIGLKGGHSGCDIHLQRGNAVKLLARILHTGYLDAPFLLARLEGGDKHNAIPREAFAVLAVSQENIAALQKLLDAEFENVRTEFAPAEPGMVFEIAESDTVDTVWDDAATQKVLGLVNGLPHGVLSMSYDISDLVETSTNLAAAKSQDGAFRVLMSTRSSVATALEGTRRRIRALASLVEAEVEENNAYPGWKPDLKSDLLDIMRGVHKNMAGKDPEVLAVHAGLECGIIGEKYPGMDMISIGPEIEFPHSPDERVNIPTVKNFYDLLLASLKALSS